MRELVRSQEAFFTNAADQLSEADGLYRRRAGRKGIIYIRVCCPRIFCRRSTRRQNRFHAFRSGRPAAGGWNDRACRYACRPLCLENARVYPAGGRDNRLASGDNRGIFEKSFRDVREYQSAFLPVRQCLRPDNRSRGYRFRGWRDSCRKGGRAGRHVRQRGGLVCRDTVADKRDKDTVLALSETTERVQQLAERSAFLLADQNERTAGLFNDAISSMQQSAELSAKTVASELSMNLGTTAELINNTVANLSEIAQSINRSAEQFASGISTSYNDFGNQINERLAGVTQSLSDSISDQCQKIAQSTETCSTSLCRTSPS